MEAPTNQDLESLIGAAKLDIWNSLTERIDLLYDVDRIWDKGFGDWQYEYKYRRGGKTLCTFYAKQDSAVLLIVLGKAEREKFETARDGYSKLLLTLYDSTKSYHDGKWLWIPLDDSLSIDDITRMLQLKRKPNRK